MKVAFGIILASWLTFVPYGAASAQSASDKAVNPFQLVSDHVTASVADLEKESNWYRRILGFQLVGDFEADSNLKVKQVGIPGYRIDLVWRRGSVRGQLAEGNLQQGWLHVVFKTPILDDFYKQLLAEGMNITASSDNQSKLLHFSIHDPEGNEIGFGR